LQCIINLNAAISQDLGDPNLFLTLNMDPRSNSDVRRLIHQLEFGTQMPDDYPFEVNYGEIHRTSVEVRSPDRNRLVPEGEDISPRVSH